MPVEIRLLGADDLALLERVAPDVFDHDVRAELAAEFLRDPRHHLAVALDGGEVVGFASAVHYVHPDKQPELWIDEVAVAPAHRRRGIGKRLLDELFAIGRRLGCVEAWVLTEEENEAARRLYGSLGGRASRAVMFSFRLRP